MSSWPALFAAALATWLVLKGPASTKPAWVRRICRVAIAFFLYSGFLYLLKWNPFWKLLSVDVENRNKLEGFLILLSTLSWLVATLRALLLGSRFPAHNADPPERENHIPRKGKALAFRQKGGDIPLLFHAQVTQRSAGSVDHAIALDRTSSLYFLLTL